MIQGRILGGSLEVRTLSDIFFLNQNKFIDDIDVYKSII